MKKGIGLVIIALGVILILLPYVPGEIIKLKSNSTVNYINDITVEELRENQQGEGDYDFDRVTDVGISSTLKASRKFDKKLVIGQLIIPDININLPVLKGLSESNMLAGAATMKKDQVMGKGNFSLAGHHMKRKDILFGRLMDIKKGSIIMLTDKKTVYEYVVYDTAVVPDTAVDMISDYKSEERGKPVISLMTCYYSSRTKKRFFALAELVKEYPYDNTFDMSGKQKI